MADDSTRAAPAGHRRRRPDAAPTQPFGPAVARPNRVVVDTHKAKTSTARAATTVRTTATTAMTTASSNAGATTTGSAVVASASKRKTPKPNRQRCKEFRERRKQHVGGLEEKVQTLREEVSELVTTKSIYTSKMMLKRHHQHGSLEKLVREYYTLFRYGVPVERPLRAGVEPSAASRSSALVKAQTQRDFLHRVVDPEAVYGDHNGFMGALAQWSYFTSAYASFVGDVNRVHITGPEEDPILYCFTTYHVILSRNTIKYLFPHAIHNEDLTSRVIGMYMPVSVVGIYRFTEDGRIISETANIELAEALLSAGCLVEDVEVLMGGIVISQDGQVPDRLQTEEHHMMKELEFDLDESKEEAQAKEKLRISFLLDQGEDSEEKENASRKGNSQESDE